MRAMRQGNRLADEKSPYLLQHADNPVDWQPWGAAAPSPPPDRPPPSPGPAPPIAGPAESDGVTPAR